MVATLLLLNCSACATQAKIPDNYHPEQLTIYPPAREACPHIKTEKDGKQVPAQCISFLEADAVEIVSELSAACIALGGTTESCSILLHQPPPTK